MVKNRENNGTEEIGLVTPTPEVVQYHGHLPICHIWASHEPECVSYKPLDGFALFKIRWNGLNL